MQYNETELKSLLRDIENPAVDKECWIPRREGVVSSHRKAMSDISEHNGRYFVSTPFAFDELYTKPARDPVMDSLHLSAAEFLSTLHEVATRATGYGKLNMLMADYTRSASSMPAGFCPLTLLKLISTEMERWQYALCERICLKPLRSNDWEWINAYRDSVRQSFESLGKAIEKSIDILNVRLQNAHNYEGRSVPKIQEPAQ